MADTISFENEPGSNAIREKIAAREAKSQRTFTPTQAVLVRSSGLYHWTPEDRRLADFTSGVLVTNLGHHPRDWLRRFARYLNWDESTFVGGGGYALLPTFTAYNALTPLESDAVDRQIASLRQTKFGSRLEKLLWSASGSEGVIKAIWAALNFQPEKDIILATRGGFHGKKGLAGAVTGDENAPERDPRVRFISFPKEECFDLSQESPPLNPTKYLNELERLADEFPNRLNCLVTEPYLGGGGSFHPPAEYHRMLENFCRDHDILLILDEVQSNFGRTGTMYAFEKYGISPDIVVLGKGMGNGIPVNAIAGRADCLGAMSFGMGSDTWSAHPLGCAAVLATLDVFESSDVLAHAQIVSQRIEAGLRRIRRLPIIAAIRGEGMVWGIQLSDYANLKSEEVANRCVKACYEGTDAGEAIHLLGPLAGNVLRVSPPLTITIEEADYWMDVMYRIFESLSAKLNLLR